MRLREAWLCAGLLLVCSSPHAQTTLTIEQIAQRVLVANGDLLAARQAIESAQAARVTASALINPRLEFQLGPHRLSPATGSGGTASSIGLVQPIENPQLRSARIRGADQDVLLSRQAFASLHNDLSARVRLLAYEVLLRDEETRAAAAAVQLLEQTRSRVRQRVETGEAARYELIKADAEIISARQRMQNAALKAEQIRLSISRLAGGTLPPDLQLSASLEDESAVSPVVESEVQLLQGNLDLRALEAELTKRDAGRTGARASVWPSVDLVVQQSREPDLRQQLVGLSVALPVWDKRRGAIDQAEAEWRRAQIRLDARKAELRQEWLIALKSLEMAQSKVRALSQGAVREAEAALRVAEAAYRFGERGILDVLDAQRVLRAVRADLLEARYELLAARSEIDRLLGRYAPRP